MKTLRHTVLALALLALPLGAGAQNHVKDAMDKAREEGEAKARRAAAREQVTQEGGIYMRMMVENGDTVYLDNIRSSWSTARAKRKSEKQWREYYKLVWRFAKVYPYAEAAGKLQKNVDSIIVARNMGVVKKTSFIEKVQKQLFKNYEGAFRQMTISQGALMMKLIDRETGMSSYSIIKEYKNGVAAGFWQGIAKLFDNDLKSQYDPEGADRNVEELVQIWKAGDFPSLYWSIFREDPPVINVPDINLDKL